MTNDNYQITVTSNPLLKICSVEQFWIDWNKFKSLKEFL
jgi:hypothetical protein